MDFRKDLEFHDDNSGRMTDKAKESILLMKTKMFRSHDLILQYNNIMKECDRLKGDLCMAQEEAVKFQKENNSQVSKITKLESQVSNQKTSCQELEQKIAEQEVKIASDKCHVDQLICKVKELENSHSGMTIEADITKSSLKEKIKGLEYELKKLKKSQSIDSEKSLKSSKRKSLTRNQLIGIETADVGTNTVQEIGRSIEMKVSMTEKSTMTDEFYHIKDNPYPIFCDNCQSLTKPDIEKFCKMMTYHPPMLSKILSPPTPFDQKLTNCEASSNIFVEPLEPIEQNEVQKSVIDLVTPEIESLKQKLSTLERKIKKKTKQSCAESKQQPCGNCYAHPYQMNRYSMRRSNRGDVMLPIFSDVQTDFLIEIMNRVMNSANEKLPRPKKSRKRGWADKKKSLNFSKGKMKVSMKTRIKKCVSSSNWDVESDDDCGKKMECNSEVGHLLRLKSTNDFVEESPPTDEMERIPNESVSKNFMKLKSRSKNSDSKLRESFNDASIEEEPVEEKIVTNTIQSKNSSRRISSRIQEKSLRSREIEGKITSTPVKETSIFVDRNLNPDESLCDTNTNTNTPSKNSNIGQSKASKRRPISVSRVDRSILCSGSNASRDDSQSREEEKNSDIDVDANDNDSDLDSSVPIYSSPWKNRNLKSKVFDDDITDGERSCLQPLEEKNTRKRKRCDSPTRGNRSVKKKLLYKLRNLKKNTTNPVSRSSANIDDSISTATIPLKTDEACDKCENEKYQNASTKESSIEIAAKRQRIAHVPKRSLSIEHHDCMQETRVDLVNDRRIEIEKRQNLDGVSEIQGTRRSPNKSKNVSPLIVEKPEDTLTRLETPLTKDLSQLGGCSEILEDCSSIFQEKNESCTKTPFSIMEKIGKAETFAEKAFDDAAIPETAEIFNDNTFAGSNWCEDKETREKDDEKLLKNHSNEMPENEMINIEQAPKEFFDLEPSSVEIRKADLLKPQVETCIKSIDESPASPEGPKILNTSNSYSDSTISPKEHIQHESVYENAVLPDTISSDDIPFLQPNIETRKLIKYDTALFDKFECNDGEINISSDQKLFFNESDTTATIKQEKLLSKNVTTSPQPIVKDLRTRRVLFSPVKSIVVEQKDQRNITILDSDSSDRAGLVSNCRGIRNLETLLTRQLGILKKNKPTNTKVVRKAAATKLHADAEKTVRTELNNLVGSEEWSSVIHTSVVTKLCQVPSQRTVAKCIVDVLVERAGLGETLDRTHTPPAPVMTKTQQRIAALINVLERDSSMSGIFELIRAGISFNLFRLGYVTQLSVVEYLTRMLTVMARLKKDRESVRIMLCDALYFLGRLAPNAIHVALSIWPEVFPMHNARSDVILNCLVHLIRQIQSPKAMGIKRLFRDYYRYPENDQQPTQLIRELISQLTKEYTKDLEVTILLIAKRQGTVWTHKHIVHGGLIELIEDDDCPWISNIITLLGFILRTFPIDDEDKTVATIVEKLCKMLESARGSPRKEEGIVGALLSLARHTSHFKRIADTVLKWKPAESIQTGTMEQLETFFKVKSLDWWENWKNRKSK
ncbi:uncharacterized protein [Venturia canescens]|uniref:uncharacterized protein n=1 Tax=Venturia canescens TaxID=32260 RepID=UPI001C9BBFF5|nr:uncharacterized protein LOC122411467 [Venturia canescens]